MDIFNLFHLPPLPLTEEQTDILLQSGRVRVERIVSTGQSTDWLCQDSEELVFLLEGRAELAFADRQITLSKGDMLRIAPRERHRVASTSAEPPCVWLCVHLPGDGTPSLCRQD